MTRFKNYKYYFNATLFLLMLEAGLQLEAHYYKPSYNNVSDKHGHRILIFGDCVSLQYPRFLREYLAKNNINVELYDNIVYHDLSVDLGKEREELIQEIKPDVIISMNGLFEVNGRNHQYSFAQKKHHKEAAVFNAAVNFKTVSYLKKMYRDYFTEEGKVKRLTQEFLSSNSREDFDDLEDELLTNNNVISDSYSRAFTLWITSISPIYKDRKVQAEKILSGRKVVAAKIDELENRISVLPNGFKEEEFKDSIKQLIPSFWSYQSTFIESANTTEFARLQRYENIIKKHDSFGFSFLEAMESEQLLNRAHHISHADIASIEQLLGLLAQDNSSLKLLQMTDKACSLNRDEMKNKTKLQCKLDVLDLSQPVAEYFEILNGLQMNEEESKTFAELKSTYKAALPDNNFDKNNFSFDIRPTNYGETKLYYDDLVKFVSDNHYKLIIMQYPTFSLPFLNDYKSAKNNIYVYDTPSVIKSQEKYQDFLNSSIPSVYNSSKLTRKGFILLGMNLGEFIIANNILK